MQLEEYREVDMLNYGEAAKRVKDVANNKVGRLVETYPSAKYSDIVQVGTIVGHSGTSGRRGWKGIIIAANPNDTDKYVSVYWILNRHNCSMTPVTQSYSKGFFINNTKVYPTISANMVERYTEKIYTEQSPVEKDIVEKGPTMEEAHDLLKKESNSNYIIWSPDGVRNPKKVHNTLEEAEDVATEMAARHQQDFFVCKQVAKAIPIYTSELERL